MPTAPAHPTGTATLRRTSGFGLDVISKQGMILFILLTNSLSSFSAPGALAASRRDTAPAPPVAAIPIVGSRSPVLPSQPKRIGTHPPSRIAQRFSPGLLPAAPMHDG